VKENQSQQLCYDYIDKKKKNTSPNRLTIKQFIQSYTNFSENKFDGQQGLKWTSFSKTNQFSSKIFKFDEKDDTDAINNEKNQLKEVGVDDIGIPNHKNHDTSDTSNTINNEILKSDSIMVEHNNRQNGINYSNNSCLFECYYCDEFSGTDYKIDYEKHVVLEHPNKLAYPSIVDLKKRDISPKGKEWEI
jgi:hypothetical protein